MHSSTKNQLAVIEGQSPVSSGGCTPRATRAMARGSAQKIAEEVQKIAEEE